MTEAEANCTANNMLANLDDSTIDAMLDDVDIDIAELPNPEDGLKAMDAEARAAGHTPITGKYIEVQIEAHDDMEAMGFGILLDPAHRKAAQAQRPDLTMITPREAALGYRVKLHVPLVQAVKEHFPAAHITKVKPKTPVDYAGGGDPIPF